MSRYDQVMANPARELADLLTGWRVVPRGQTTYGSRSADAPDDLGFWRTQIRAVELLTLVSNVLRSASASGRQVGHYERAEPLWCRAVFAPDTSWNQPASSDTAHANSSTIDILYGLADYIDVTAGEVVVDSASQHVVAEALEEITSLLSGLSLDPVEKRYVFELIMSIRSVLDESAALGSVDILRRIHELVGYLTKLSQDLEADTSTASIGQRLRAAASRVVPYARFGTGFALGALSGVADLQQITAGH